MDNGAVLDLVEDVVCGGMAQDSTNDVFVQPTFPGYLGKRCLLIDREGRGHLKLANGVQAAEIVLERQLAVLPWVPGSIYHLPDCRSDEPKSPWDQA